MLSLLLPDYYSLNPRIRAKHTKDQYKFALGDLARAIQHQPDLPDLTDDSLARMIADGQQRGLAAKTINERVGRIKALWRWLADRGQVATRPTIGNIPEPRRTPVAWSQSELKRLIQACRDWPKNVGPIKGADWWVSLHYACWDSGERISALLECRWDWLSGGWLCIPAEARKGKTSDRTYKLAPDTLKAIEAIKRPKRALIWPWPMNRSYLWVTYTRLRRAANLPTDRRSAFHRIRRSVATHCEAAGGNATELLDHSDRRITRESYLDPRFLNDKQAVDYLFRPEG